MKANQLRINIFLSLVFVAFSLIIWRLFILSYLRHDYYSRTAQAQTQHINNILSRGNIYFTDKDGSLVLAATNKKSPVVYIVPTKIDQNKAPEIAQTIANITDLKSDQILPVLSSKIDYARTLPKKLTSDQVNKIQALNIRGVGISYDMDRYYPNQELAADVLGFLGYNGSNDKSGQYGVESFYNQELYGLRENTQPTLNSGFSRISELIFGPKNTADTKEDNTPEDVVLTVDKNIQTFVEETLDNALKKWSATGGSAIVEDPNTGRILAMADRPSFNPNTYNIAAPETFLNSDVQQIFEPGSSFKPITMAAGLDLGKVMPQTTYEDPGVVLINGYPIKNFNEKSFGTQTMSQVLEKSLNTGAMFVENLVGDDNFLNYVINMGFGQKTGIDLPGEINGDVSNLYSGRKINFLTASFGQGIAVTPIQLINAYSAIANGGKLMKPYIVEKTISDKGVERVTKPEVIGIPISEKTSAKLKMMLVGEVDNGFDKARIKGYDVAGKTGTAQIPDERGGYDENRFIHNFLGFAPAYNPKFVIMIKMDKPQGIKFAADSLSPVFREMADFLIHYYNIPPTR